jgi:hypothetical protein
MIIKPIECGSEILVILNEVKNLTRWQPSQEAKKDPSLRSGRQFSG